MLIAMLTTLLLTDSISDLKEILRDAQVTNRARLKQGHAVLELRYWPNRLKRGDEVVIQAEIEWLDERIRQRIRCFDPTGITIGRVWDQPIELAPWDENVLNDSELYLYNAKDSFASIVPNKSTALSSILYFHPRQAWMSCCPPIHSQGRTWLSMIDQVAGEGSGPRSEVEVVREGLEYIKHTRRDPNGTLVEILFSLKFGGQVVKILVTGENARLRSIHGNYEWKRLGEAFVLDSCHFTESLPGKPEIVNREYHLKVKSVKLNSVDPSKFNKSTFLARLPAGIKVHDAFANRNYTVGSTRKISTVELRSFSKILRSRGFAKPD